MARQMSSVSVMVVQMQRIVEMMREMRRVVGFVRQMRKVMEMVREMTWVLVSVGRMKRGLEKRAGANLNLCKGSRQYKESREEDRRPERPLLPR